MCLVLVPEIAERGEHRIGGTLPEPAEGGLLYNSGQVFQFHHHLEPHQVLLFSCHRGVGRDDLLEDFVHSLGPFPAGDALSAGFIRGKGEKILGHIDHTGVFIHDHDSARAHHRSDLFERVVVDFGIEILGRNTAADVVDDLPEGDPHRHFYQARVVDLPGKGEHLGAPRVFDPHAGEKIRPFPEDVGDIGVGFDVVHVGRLSVKP